MEITFAIIKPDAVRRYYTGDIIKRIESSGLHISGMRLIHLTRGQAEAFYDVHKDRPFFGSLCDYMSSGPVVVMALSGEDAVSRWRQLMGATNPADAAPARFAKTSARISNRMRRTARMAPRRRRAKSDFSSASLIWSVRGSARLSRSKLALRRESFRIELIPSQFRN